MSLTLLDLIQQVEKEEANEGDIYEGDFGKVVVNDGGLFHLTEDNYLSEPVELTSSNIYSSYVKKKDATKEVDLNVAFELLQRNKEAIVVFDGLYDIDGRPLEQELNSVQDLYKVIETTPFDTATIMQTLINSTYRINTETAHRGLKINSDQAFEIHHKHRKRHVSVKALSEEYGITTRMVYYILDGTYWTTVKSYFDSEPQGAF